MTFHIITIFPEIFDSYFNESIIKRAKENNLVDIKTYNLRDWTTNKHKSVDDSPYGGGAGMVMMIEPLVKAINHIKNEIKSDPKIFILSAKGKTWKQSTANEFTNHQDIILICGRYEGVDDRISNFIDGEISIGDYVLTGGEIGAMTIVDSVTRLIPGVLGNNESAEDESHSEEGILEYPQYTRPEVFSIDDKEYKVPDILLSGNHKKIDEWRKDHKTIKKN